MAETYYLDQAQAHPRSAIIEVASAHAQAILAGQPPTTYKVDSLMVDLHDWLTQLGATPEAEPESVLTPVDAQ
jgi:hypothetical protein